MKLLFASDIHGSEKYLSLLLEKYKEEKADKLLLLGDLLYHGPRNDLPDGYNPKAVVKILNELKKDILAVRGNCEAEVDQMVLDFPVLADYATLFVDGLEITLTHGSTYNPQNPLPLKDGRIVMYGHTHIPSKTTVDGVYYLNTGSISIPKNNSSRSYIVYEKGTFYWKSLLDGTVFDKLSVNI